MTLMPCFQPRQAAADGMLVGRILAGYSELEVQMLRCLINVEGQIDLPVRDLFSERGEQRRIEKARLLLTPDYTQASLLAQWNETIDDMDWCRQIRNQYAHCQWFWAPREGLCFVDLEALAKNPTPITDVTVNKRSITLPLLEEQEVFFNYVKESFEHLGSAYTAWDQHRSGVRRPIHVFAKPSKITRPLLYN